MKTFRIVAGTNFSECANNAVTFAFHLLKGNVLDVKLAFCLTEFVDVTDLTEEMRETHEGSHPLEEVYSKKLSELGKLYSEMIGKKSHVSPVLLHGYPDVELTQFATSSEADLLVIGDTIQANAFGDFFGSKTSDIIKKSTKPVLAVPLGNKISASDIHRVLYLTDFRKTEFESLHKLIKWMPELDVMIYCLHYCHENPDKWDHYRMEELQTYCNQTYRNQLVVCEMLYGNDWVLDISQYIESKSIQLVSMTKKHRNTISKWFSRDIDVEKIPHTTFPLLLFCD